ncbi:MAG: hypothetical protein U1D35_06375, partial [Paracoccaceae bacterium]|nr:hypothetical protein [Paracoccaceae bacterium]
MPAPRFLPLLTLAVVLGTTTAMTATRAQETALPETTPPADPGYTQSGPEVPLADDQPAPRPAPMTLERLTGILRAVDPGLVVDGPMLRLTVETVTVLVVTDSRADRMRILVPIRKTEDLTPKDLARLMQANFDTALDARYAIAKGTLWATYIHPLSPLQKDQLLSGLGQTVNLGLTYGT